MSSTANRTDITKQLTLPAHKTSYQLQLERLEGMQQAQWDAFLERCDISQVALRALHALVQGVDVRRPWEDDRLVVDHGETLIAILDDLSGDNTRLVVHYEPENVRDPFSRERAVIVLQALEREAQAVAEFSSLYGFVKLV